jgi:hypothetical protein
MKRNGVLLAFAAAALLGCSGGAGAAARSVPRGFFGVDADGPAVDGTVPLAGQISRMSGAGAETLGVSFDWSKAQPAENGPFDFSGTDKLVLAAAARRIRVYPTVIQAPPWARLHPQEQFSPPASPDTYARYVGALVRRYGSRGSLWAAHHEVPRLPILDWQIWNEPAGADFDNRGSVFWVDGNNPFEPRYVPLLRKSYAAIKAADPKARVVLAGLVGRSWRTLAAVYHAGARPYFDAVSLHPYTEKVHDVSRIVRYDRGVMNRRGDRRKPILITELAWPAFVPVKDLKKSGRAKVQRIQSGWLKSVYTDLLAKRRALGIRMLLWYTWMTRDTASDYTFDYTGLVRLDSGNKVVGKPALGTLSRIARRYEGRR